MPSDETWVEIDDEQVRITSPGKLMFPSQGWTKWDVVQHYMICADGALAGVFGRPTMLKRWPNGVGEEPFYQKRAPESARERVTVRFPSGRTAGYFVPRLPADVIWMAQLNCLDLNPWPTRAEQVENPDELRIDLDPTPEATWGDVQRVALGVGELLDDLGLTGYPKTSGSKGMHIYVRIEPLYTFTQVRRCALAFAREMERRLPELVTTKWWKEERHGVFIDYNQMARDRTIASAYSVRPTGWVSAPLTWDEVPEVELQDFPLDRFADRYVSLGDVMEPMDDVAFRLDVLLDMVDDDEEHGIGEAVFPPQFPKQPGEPRRVQPSRRKADP